MRAEENVEVPRPKGKSRLDAAARKLGKHLDVELSVLRGADRSWAVSKARKQVAYVLARRMGYRLNDVAVYLGRDAATIATLLARMNERLANEPKEKRKIQRLGKIVES